MENVEENYRQIHICVSFLQLKYKKVPLQLTKHLNNRICMKKKLTTFNCERALRIIKRKNFQVALAIYRDASPIKNIQLLLNILKIKYILEWNFINIAFV